MADVAPFEIRDPRVGPKTLVQLPVTDVERHHVGCSSLQETVGEPARRSAGIQGSHAGDIEAEHVEGMIELLCAASHEAGRRAGDHDRIAGRHLSRRLVGDRSVDQDAMVTDQRLSF